MTTKDTTKGPKQSLSVITDAAKLMAKIDGTLKTVAKVHQDMQAILQSCVYHAVGHGNIDPILHLWGGLGATKGIRRSAVQAWLDTLAPVLIDKESGFKFNRDKIAMLAEFTGDGSDKGPTNPTLQEAEQYAASLAGEDWSTYKPEQLEEKSYDVEAALRAILKKIDLAHKPGSKIKVQHEELVVAIKAILPVADLTAPSEGTVTTPSTDQTPAPETEAQAPGDTGPSQDR